MPRSAIPQAPEKRWMVLPSAAAWFHLTVTRVRPSVPLKFWCT